MVKGWSELKSLAPFSWDTRVDDHPPGEAAMRDFSDAYAYASSAERPRRSTGQYTQTPTPLIKRKRTSASGGKVYPNTSRLRSKHASFLNAACPRLQEARTLSHKKVVRPGQVSLITLLLSCCAGLPSDNSFSCFGIQVHNHSVR